MHDVIDFASTLAAKSDRTARLRMAAVRKFHEYLHATGATHRDAAKLVPGPKIRDTTTRAHTRDQLDLVRDQLRTDRDRAVWDLMADCLLRAEEVCHLQLHMLDPVNGEVTVVGKGGKRRTVPMSGRAAESVERYVRHARGSSLSPFLFRGCKGGTSAPIGYYSVLHLVRTAARRAGLAPSAWTPHTLRRAAADELRRLGVDAFVLRDLMGHSSVDTTAIYMRPDIVAELRRALPAH